MSIKSLCLFLMSIVNTFGSLRSFFPHFPNSVHFENETGTPLFLTPLIEAGNITEALLASRVVIPDHENVESYAGYLTVNKECDSNLFFWFFPALHNSIEAPVLLWLQGGPGGSSLFGLFVEHGPFVIDGDIKAKSRQTSWFLTHNMIYVDNPVGTGFSFTNGNCFAKNQDDVSRDMIVALSQFFKLFSQYQNNDFYVTGESYAGKYVPSIAHKIHINNNNNNNNNNNINNDSKKFSTPISLKGIAIGDGLIDPETMTNYGDFLFGIGLIDEEAKAYFKMAEEIQIKYIKEKNWIKAFEIFDTLLNGDLTNGSSYFKNVTGFEYYFNYLENKTPLDFSYYPLYVDQPFIRRAIHVGNISFNDGKRVEENLKEDIMQSVKPYLEDLLENYRVLLYNGQLDIIIGWPLSESFITTLKWSGADEYLFAKRNFWRVGPELAGYSKEIKNFTQVFVRNAGHMIPFDQPKWAFDMINRFTSGKSFSRI